MYCLFLNSKMKKLHYIFILFTIVLNAQSKIDSLKTTNNNYLEDQLYTVVTYNLLTSKPSSINLRGFSNTMSFGYIRDIPFNEKRNLGIGIGLGYGNNSYFHNMKITANNNQTTFSDFEDTDDFDSNKLIFHTIDVPFEFRIRNSTPIKSKFTRIYIGMKFSYVFFYKSQFNLEGIQKYKNFNQFNKLQYGLTTSIGHGTWNGYFYYGLTNLFDKALFNETEALNMKSVRFGLVFYIL